LLVQHHEKYKEIHGEDKIVMMDYDKHRALHTRLRKEGKCAIPAEELRVISTAAYNRSDKGKRTAKNYKQKYDKLTRSKENCIVFTETVGINVLFVETIKVNPKTSIINYRSSFRGHNKSKLKFIDI